MIGPDEDSFRWWAQPVVRPRRGRHVGEAKFGAAYLTCSLAGQCTTAKGGGRITTSPLEVPAGRRPQAQADSAWRADYKATRPKVERKIGHLMRRHGGRRATSRATPITELSSASIGA